MEGKSAGSEKVTNHLQSHQKHTGEILAQQAWGNAPPLHRSVSFVNQAERHHGKQQDFPSYHEECCGRVT